MHGLIGTAGMALLWAGTLSFRFAKRNAARRPRDEGPLDAVVRPRDMVLGFGPLSGADVMALLREYDRSGRGVVHEDEARSADVDCPL